MRQAGVENGLSPVYPDPPAASTPTAKAHRLLRDAVPTLNVRHDPLSDHRFDETAETPITSIDRVASRALQL